MQAEYANIVNDYTLARFREEVAAQRNTQTPAQRARQLQQQLSANGPPDCDVPPSVFKEYWRSVLCGIDCVAQTIDEAVSVAQATKTLRSLAHPRFTAELRELATCGHENVRPRTLRLAHVRLLRDVLLGAVVPRLQQAAAGTEKLEVVAREWGKYKLLVRFTRRVLHGWGDQFSVQPLPSQSLTGSDFSLSAGAVWCWATEVFRREQGALVGCLLGWCQEPRQQHQRQQQQRRQRQQQQQQQGAAVTSGMDLVLQDGDVARAVRTIVNMFRTMGLLRHADFYRLRNALELTWPPCNNSGQHGSGGSVAGAGKVVVWAALLPLRYAQPQAPTTRRRADVSGAMEAPNSPYDVFARALHDANRAEVYPRWRDELLRDATTANNNSRKQVSTTPVALSRYLAAVGTFTHSERTVFVNVVGVSIATWDRLDDAIVHVMVGSLQSANHPIFQLVVEGSNNGAETSGARHSNDDNGQTSGGVAGGVQKLLEEGGDAVRPVFLQLLRVEVARQIGEPRQGGKEQQQSSAAVTRHGGGGGDGSRHLPAAPQGLSPLVEAFATFCRTRCVGLLERYFSRPWPEHSSSSSSSSPSSLSSNVPMGNAVAAGTPGRGAIPLDDPKIVLVRELVQMQQAYRSLVERVFAERTAPFNRALDLALAQAVNYLPSNEVASGIQWYKNGSSSISGGTRGDDESHDGVAEFLAGFLHAILLAGSQPTLRHADEQRSRLKEQCDAVVSGLGAFLGNTVAYRLRLERHLQQRLLSAGPNAAGGCRSESSGGRRSAKVHAGTGAGGAQEVATSSAGGYHERASRDIEEFIVERLRKDHGVLFALRMQRMLFDVHGPEQQTIETRFSEAVRAVNARVRPPAVSRVRVLSHSAWSMLARETFAAVLFFQQSGSGKSSRRGALVDFDGDLDTSVDMFAYDELQYLPVKVRIVGALLKRLYQEQFPQRRLRTFPSRGEGPYEFHLGAFHAALLQAFKKGRQGVGLALADFGTELGIVVDTCTRSEWRTAAGCLRSALDDLTFRSCVPAGCSRDLPLVVTTKSTTTASRPGTPGSRHGSRPTTPAAAATTATSTAITTGRSRPGTPGSRPSTAGSRPGTASSRPGTASGVGGDVLYKLNRKFFCQHRVVTFPVMTNSSRY